MGSPNILPDSRLRDSSRGVVQGQTPYGRLNWVPIFCANCGADGGYVPEENCTFACYLCDPCATKLGPILGTYAEPDAVFWERVKQEQVARYGRPMTPEEEIAAAADESHPLTKLFQEKPQINRD